VHPSIQHSSQGRLPRSFICLAHPQQPRLSLRRGTAGRALCGGCEVFLQVAQRRLSLRGGTGSMPLTRGQRAGLQARQVPQHLRAQAQYARARGRISSGKGRHLSLRQRDVSRERRQTGRIQRGSVCEQRGGLAPERVQRAAQGSRLLSAVARRRQKAWRQQCCRRRGGSRGTAALRTVCAAVNRKIVEEAPWRRAGEAGRSDAALCSGPVSRVHS
jgi:hypothetical protein